MQFHGIGRNEHSAQAHHVTTCMHDHSHYKIEGEVAKAASASAKAQQMNQVQAQGEGQLSLSAWLEKNLSKGKRMLQSFWGSSEVAQAGEPGDKSGQAQMMAQIGDSRESGSRGSNLPGQESLQPDSTRTLHVSQVSQAAAAAPQPRIEESLDTAAAQAVGGQEENLWRKMKVRFHDIAGQLTGHLRQRDTRTQTRSSFQMNQERPKAEARPRTKKSDRDALEIDSYRMEESYLLDSYDRKGEYSKISTKK